VPGHASNAERIERAASEAAAAVKELDAKKAAKAKGPKKPRASSVKVPARVKIVWAVGRPGVASSKSFPYKERAAADAEAARLGKGCMVTPLKVPME
jgi:hypothetical protein